MPEIVAAMPPMSFKPLTKFFKTPKGLLVVALALLIPLAATTSGFAVLAPGVAAAAIAAMLIDAPILRYRDKAWSFPSGALLTGLLVAMVLGILIFGDWPDALSLFGSAIIIGAGLFLWRFNGSPKKY